jgi:SET domain-containing protein
MTLPKKQLYIKESNIPGAGSGLFTKEFIEKGTRILEYKGKITTWKEVLEGNQFNPYVFYITRNYVIDGMPYKKALGRYANDAEGLTKIKGLQNNSKYVIEKKRVFIEAIKDILVDEEILVGYGKEYGDVIRQNKKLLR